MQVSFEKLLQNISNVSEGIGFQHIHFQTFSFRAVFIEDATVTFRFQLKTETMVEIVCYCSGVYLDAREFLSDDVGKMITYMYTVVYNPSFSDGEEDCAEIEAAAGASASAAALANIVNEDCGGECGSGELGVRYALLPIRRTRSESSIYDL